MAVLRALEVAFQGLGTVGPGMAVPVGPGMAVPVGNRWKGQAVIPRVMTEAAAGHKVGHSERCMHPFLDSGPVNTWRSQRLLPCLHGWSQEGVPGRRRAASALWPSKFHFLCLSFGSQATTYKLKEK